MGIGIRRYDMYTPYITYEPTKREIERKKILHRYKMTTMMKKLQREKRKYQILRTKWWQKKSIADSVDKQPWVRLTIFFGSSFIQSHTFSVFIHTFYFFGLISLQRQGIITTSQNKYNFLVFIFLLILFPRIFRSERFTSE